MLLAAIKAPFQLQECCDLAAFHGREAIRECDRGPEFEVQTIVRNLELRTPIVRRAGACYFFFLAFTSTALALYTKYRST